MKTLAITTALIASILAGAFSASAAPRKEHLDGYKLFEDIANRGGQ